MSKIYNIYRQNINGVIFTLFFHILVLVVLIVTQFRIKQEFVESEMIIDFGEMVEEEQQPIEEEQQEEQLTQEITSSPSNQTTNAASNRSKSNSDKFFDQEYYNELEKAKQLSQNVSGQLSKEIPTLDDLRMPEKTQDNSESSEPSSFSGDSNIEYVLENRYHTRLPIPVYLAQKGGRVVVHITVDRKGNVVSAEIPNTEGIDEMILSYAKTAALRTKFNADPKAPNSQKGTITYRFVRQ
jgi:TonB family protein